MFKLYAARHAIGGKNKYVQLFDAIDRQDHYDECALLERNRPLRSLDLKSMKPYLHDLILRSLRDGTRNKASLTKVQYQVDKAEILMYKGLYAQAATLLERTKQLARRDTHLLEVLAILYHQNTIKIRLEETHSLEHHQKLYSETLEVFAELQDNLAYYDLFMQIYYLQLETFNPRNTDERRRLQAIMSSPLLEDESKPLTSYGRMTFCEVHARSCELLSDFEGQFAYMRKKLEIFESDPDFLRLHRYEYIYTAGSVLYYCTWFAHYDEFDRRLAALKGRRESSGPYHIDLELNIYYAEIWNARRRCRFDAVRAMIPEVWEFLKKHEERIETSTIFDFETTFLSLSIEAGDLDGALRWLGELLNDRRLYRFSRFLEMAKLMGVIVRFETGDVEGIESAVRSVFRLLRRKEKLSEFEAVFLLFLRKLPGITGRGALRAAFTELRDRLQELRGTPDGRMLLYQFDFIPWLESKIVDRPFAELLREREEK